MKLFSATTFGGIFAISSLTFVACMGTSQEANPSDTPSITQTDLPQGGLGYVVGLSKKAVTAVNAASNSSAANGDLATSKAALQAAGVCQGFINVFDELEGFSTDATILDTAGALSFDGYPNLQRVVSCVLPWVEQSMGANIDDISVAPATGDIMALSDCICGGSGSIFGIYEGYVNTNWQGFSPIQATGFSPASSGSGFNASAAQTIGAGFSPSASPMGNGFSPVTP